MPLRGSRDRFRLASRNVRLAARPDPGPTGQLPKCRPGCRSVGTSVGMGGPPRSMIPAASMDPQTLPPEAESAAPDSLWFETFLADLAARLLAAPPEDVDRTIQASLQELGAFLGSERGGIGLFSEDGSSLVFRYGYFTPEAPRQLFEADLAQALPWYVGELRAGRPVIVRQRARRRTPRGRGGARDRRGAGPPVDDRPPALGRRRGPRGDRRRPLRAALRLAPRAPLPLRGAGLDLRQHPLPPAGPCPAAAGGRPQPLGPRLRVERDRRSRPRRPRSIADEPGLAALPSPGGPPGRRGARPGLPGGGGSRTGAWPHRRRGRRSPSRGR